MFFPQFTQEQTDSEMSVTCSKGRRQSGMEGAWLSSGLNAITLPSLFLCFFLLLLYVFKNKTILPFLQRTIHN